MYKYPPLPTRLFYICLAVFLVFQSYKFCMLQFHIQSVAWQWEIFVGFILNLFVTGVFAFSVFSLPVERLLPNAYYRIRQPKALKKFGSKIGIEGFRKFLLATVWKDKSKQKGYFDGTAAGLESFDINAKKSDFGHLFPFIILSIIVVILCFYGRWISGLSTRIINIIFNFYPVILQRLHRIRIERMRKILERKNKK